MREVQNNLQYHAYHGVETIVLGVQILQKQQLRFEFFPSEIFQS